VNGESDVTFAVTFENIGSSPIYFAGSALSASIATNSSVLQKVDNNTIGIFAFGTLDHGQNSTLLDPVMGDGYMYQLLQAGSIRVTLSLNWSTNPRLMTLNPNSTTILAQFIFA